MTLGIISSFAANLQNAIGLKYPIIHIAIKQSDHRIDSGLY